jgi:hypothetical protein
MGYCPFFYRAVVRDYISDSGKGKDLFKAVGPFLIIEGLGALGPKYGATLNVGFFDSVHGLLLLK